MQQKYPASAFIVENKPGAGDNLGTDLVAKATPDGSTIGVSIGGPLAINTLLYDAIALRSAHGHRDSDPIGHPAERARGQSGARSEFSRRPHRPAP
ncbi:MAG: tripartite tricarboxylate transporter substrate-binding protein [Pseudolabrys sp.]